MSELVFLKKDPEVMLRHYECFVNWIEGWWEGSKRPPIQDLSSHPFERKIAEIKQIQAQWRSNVALKVDD